MSSSSSFIPETIPLAQNAASLSILTLEPASGTSSPVKLTYRLWM